MLIFMARLQRFEQGVRMDDFLAIPIFRMFGGDGDLDTCPTLLEAKPDHPWLAVFHRHGPDEGQVPQMHLWPQPAFDRSLHEHLHVAGSGKDRGA